MDACCFSRPFDDRRQDRARIEAEAVLSILARVEQGPWQVVGSEILRFELERIRSTERREATHLLASLITEEQRIDPAAALLAEELKGSGISGYDALHVACAARLSADVFLTVDDRILAKSRIIMDKARLIVDNPATWLVRQKELDT